MPSILLGYADQIHLSKASLEGTSEFSQTEVKVPRGKSSWSAQQGEISGISVLIQVLLLSIHRLYNFGLEAVGWSEHGFLKILLPHLLF